ncbi:MAG: membrane protein insertase YidC [Pseudomonadota bacterium]
MDNQRLFTWGLFGLLLVMCWNAWQVDYGPKPAPSEQTPADGVGSADRALSDQLPTIAAPDNASEPASDVPVLASPISTDPSRIVRVNTDVLNVEIDLDGGNIVGAVLTGYPVAKNRPDELVTLLSSDGDPYGVVQTGVLFAGANTQSPSHLATFESMSREYTLADGEESVDVALTWTRDDGVSARKVFRFFRDSYQIDVLYTLRNPTDTPINAGPYGRIEREAKVPERSMFDVQSYSFTGPVMSDGSTYDKYDIDDLQDGETEKFSTAGGWIAAIQYHFAIALVPPPEEEWNYDVSATANAFNVSALASKARITVASGGSAETSLTLFIGPKLQKQLGAISPKLPLTVDYGILTLLSSPLFTVLQWVHNVVGNWGWAIIIVTILIKLVFYPLTAASGRSMAKMRELAPRLKNLQERYKDDRPELSRQMMELYKREKINPAAGCLPLLIQMPFFLAFYWVLLESVEMRQAPFMLWIQDLSSRDPIFVLPLLMGAAMLVQQKLNPAPPDPVQAKVMSILPVVFTVFFAFFPAGLVLYWLSNTLLTIVQQWRINSVVAREQAARS